MSPCCLVDDHPKNDMSIPQNKQFFDHGASIFSTDGNPHGVVALSRCEVLLHGPLLEGSWNRPSFLGCPAQLDFCWESNLNKMIMMITR